MSNPPSPPPKAHPASAKKANGTFDFEARLNEHDEATADLEKSANAAQWTAGKGRRTLGVDVMPRPSASHEDPLNFTHLRKNLAYLSVLLTIASLTPLKSLLLPISSLLSTQLSVPYSSITALTGVPLIVGSIFGLLARILCQSNGIKRMFIIVASSLALIGALINMHAGSSYAQFMCARLMQGVGWGVVEALAGEVVRDLFFVHERTSRMFLYHLTSITFTWGAPILGGFISQSMEGYPAVIMIINIIQAFSVLALILCLPETTFDRASALLATSSNVKPKTGLKAFLSTLRFSTPYSKTPFSISRAILPLKAFAAPSTLLIVLLSAPFYASALGSAHIISLLFAAMPTFLFPARIGFIYIMSLVFALIFYGLASLISYIRSKPPQHLGARARGTNLVIAGTGLLIAVVGLLGWGLYTTSELDADAYTASGVVFSLAVEGLDISFKKVSLLLGLLIGGATILSLAGNAYLSSSSPSFTSATPHHLSAAHFALQDVLAGIFISAMPGWIASDAAGTIPGLRTTVVALAVLGTVLGSSVAAVLWCKGSEVGVLDERIMGFEGDEEELDDAEIKKWAKHGSFVE